MATTLAELISVNPATEAEIARYPVMSRHDVSTSLDRMAQRHREWRMTPLLKRCQLLREVGAVLRRNAAAYAARITAEVGKPITESLAEVEKCAFACDYFVANALTFLADEDAPSDNPQSIIRYEPLGVVFACMPWNFPFWQVFRCAAPALAAGNSVLLKHANGVTGCALDLEAVFAQAGFPADVFRALVIPVDSVASVIADPRVAAISLTGSTRAGEAVAAQAGAVLKKCVLELGGSDAFIVLDDADVAAAADVAVMARFQNNGQSCIAAKRFIVVESVVDAFTEAMVAGVEALRMGSPTEPETQLGPLARGDLRDAVERQTRGSVAQGARLISGGTRPDRPGYFLSPAVLSDCTAEMPAFTEETFGPLAALMTVRDEEAAIAVANASRYGLGGNVWTGDVDRGVRVAKRLESGGVFINGMTHSDPRLPFGGIKASGYGRELYRHGMLEFVNVKTIWSASGSA